MSDTELVAPECDLDFYGDATLRDVPEAYRTMLSLGPVVWLKRHGLHAIVGHAAVTSCLRQPLVFRSGRGVSIDDEANRMIVGSTLNSDPPDHDQTRAITFRPLTPKALESVRGRIETEAAGVVDRLVSQGAFDAARDLAPHVPLSVVRDLVGLGGFGAANMLTWAGATFELMGDPGLRRPKALKDLRALRSFLEDPATLKGLDEDGWARRATDAGLTQGIPRERAVELMRDYIAPSLDTTISAIGYGVKLFAEHPDQWDALREDPGRIGNAVEEIVRLNTPIRAFSRYVAEDTEVAGIPMAQGSRVLIVFGAANRDPARFPDPDRFDIARATRGHMGFGHGAHACLGLHLARLEMVTLFSSLAEKVRRFEPVGPVEVALNSTIHAYSKVPVRTLPA